MAFHNDIGRWGEEQARAYLLAKGYAVRHVNWRCGKLELDIVAEKDGMLVVVEVKTRSTDYYGVPEEAVTPQKIRRIVHATDSYIRRYGWTGETRFDIITVLSGNPYARIEHIEDAFLA